MLEIIPHMDYYYSAGINCLVFVITAHCGKPGFSEEPRQPQGGGGMKTGRYTAMRKIYKGDSHDMRNFKRFLAMALTMLMIVGSFTLLTSAKFEDVTDFQDEITILSELGVIKGKADGTFGFDEEVTRRQTALFMARATTGKVDDALTWQSKVNNTPFTDLDPENDYYGAISYCHNNGIVKGKSATEFAPNDSITFKEAVTMAVRALGYKGADMDAGYPWTYYSKAVSLGLDKGLENVAMDEVVTRGYMAKLLYNMMFATNSKGTTIATDAFGSSVKITNLVLVAAEGKKLVANFSLPSAKGTVAFVEFNSDGTLNLDKVYHFNWADFAELAYGEGTEEKAVDNVGASYSVVTIDGFKSLVSVTENPSKVFTSTDAPGNGKIEDVEYTLVDKWTSVYNIGTTSSGKDELIQYNTASYPGFKFEGAKTAYYAGNWYVVDKDNNILGTNGEKLLYYVGNIKADDIVTGGASTSFPFYYKIGEKYYPAYLPFDGSRYAGAATTDQLNKVPTTYTVLSKDDAKYTTNVNAYSETVAYDDNNDGVYDRAYFTAYNFGQYIVDDANGDGKKEYHFTFGTLGKDSGKKYDTNTEALVLNNLTDEELTSGDYILWAYDPINNAVTVKKVYDTVKTGYVTGIDVVNDTITVVSNLFNFNMPFGSAESIKYGVAKLPGATNTKINGVNAYIDGDDYNKTTEELVGISYDLVGKSVSFVIDEENDNRIVAIFDKKTADTPLVVTAVEYSYYNLGYIRATVIDNSGTRQVINISAINNVPVINFFGLTTTLSEGQLIFGSKQNDGTWIVSTAYTPEDATDNVVLTFTNGYGYQNVSGVPDLVVKPDGSKLVIVVVDKTSDADGEITLSYRIASGIPSNGAKLTINKGAEYYVKDNGYVYIEAADPTAGNIAKGAEFDPALAWNIIDSGWQVGMASDVIYLVSAGVPQIGNVYGSYRYSGSFFSIMTGNWNTDIGSVLYSNKLLESGKFYEVTMVKVDGVTNVIVLGDGFDITNTAKFAKINIEKVDTDNRYVKYIDTSGATQYFSDGTEIKLVDWKNYKDPGKAPATKDDDELYEAYYYVGGVSKSGKTYFLVNNTITMTTPVTGKAITGIELNTTASPNAGDKVIVEKIYATVNGVEETYEPGDADFTLATFFWYKVANDGTETLIAGETGNEYTTDSATDVGSKIKVEVILTGYTGSAVEETGKVLNPLLTELTVNNGTSDIVSGTTITAGVTLTAAVETSDGSVPGAITYAWTVDGEDAGNAATLNTTGMTTGKVITLTVTASGYVGMLTWTATVE